MHFITTHRIDSGGAKTVIYVNPLDISFIEPGADGGSNIMLSTGKSLPVMEKPDDLILKIRGFTKPQGQVTLEPTHA